LSDKAMQPSSTKLLLEGVWNALKVMRTMILVVVLLLSLSLNVAIVAVSAVTEAAEEIFERVTRKAAPAALARQQVRVLANTVASQQRSLAANATRIQHLTRLNSLRQRQIFALTELVSNVRATETARLAVQRTRVLATTARISRRIATDAIRNAGAVIGEAVPWIGIGVVAGTTALEIKDACDSMRDLSELEAIFVTQSPEMAARDQVCGIVVPTPDELWVMAKGRVVATGGWLRDSMPSWDSVSLPWQDQ
jgi:hypothetical protein